VHTQGTLETPAAANACRIAASDTAYNAHLLDALIQLQQRLLKV
jgi:hypothetical protein